MRRLVLPGLLSGLLAVVRVDEPPLLFQDDFNS